MKFLDSTYLWDAKANSIAAPGLGLGIQPCPLISMHSGEIRDSQGRIISQRPMLEPTLDVGVLADALRTFPQGGWVILDAEGAVSYGINEAFNHGQNVAGFAKWEAYIRAVKFIRPDLKIAPIMGGWHSPNLNPISPDAWKSSEDCDAIFKDRILPLIDALAIELYYVDRASPPSTGDAETFNLYGMVGAPGWGFQFNCCVEHQRARALTGKPAVHVFCITPGYPSRPETDSKFLSGARMSACLDEIAKYAPSAIALWGSAGMGPDLHPLPGGGAVGVFDPKADWVAQVKAHMSK